ncbi:OmpA family protein [Tunicatimonas pelagia]|uniref:OmpA family protein n=1 Tax=Tunicatimonas pelagia TaxID=931531 RepID=UPI002665B759|nr:OmpA family protein [Tunicatimonas pelagia]WKN44675.1 OmpA family protein [Tunicatimonas pelagia]
MKSRFFAILIFLFSSILCTNEVTAQRGASQRKKQQEPPRRNTTSYTSKSKKAIEYYEDAFSFFLRRQYGQALELLDYCLKKDPAFSEAHLQAAKIYEVLLDAARAEYHYKKVAKQQPGNAKFVEAPYQLAKMYFQQGKYADARSLATSAIETPKVAQVIRDEAQMLLANINFTEEAIQQPVDFQPRRVEGQLHQFPLQYFPVLTVDQQTMIFTGRRGVSPRYDEDIYVSHKNAQGEWQAPELLSENITTMHNEGTCAISADGRTLIFTACEGRKGYGSCDLFVSYRTGDTWSVPKNLGAEVNSSSWESQPTLSADGNTLYFVSDRSGGLGKRDIYLTRRNSQGEWSNAQNAGKTINTPRDEVSPFIHVNGQTLYFASNGRPGFGGFDLYVTEQTEKQWSEPKNLGYPINTYEDQASLFITADGQDAYYSNEEQRQGQYIRSEIYTFAIPAQIQVQNRSNYVFGKVYHALTKEPLEATIELVDLRQQQPISAVTSDPANGEYLMVLTEGSEYALYVNKDNFLFRSLTFNYLAPSEAYIQQPIEIDVYLDPVEKGRETVLNNVFFDTDKYVIQEKSKPELDKIASFLQENPTISVSINGHTDNVGSDSYNKTLSTQRAKAVYDYLLQAGVPAERLAYQGYGAEKPIADNNTAEGRQKNRRIAFEIL